MIHLSAFQSLFSQTRELGKNVACVRCWWLISMFYIYQVEWVNKILGAQKFSAEWYNHLLDPILIKTILGLWPPPFLQEICEKLHLRGFYILKTTFSKILSLRQLHIDLNLVSTAIQRLHLSEFEFYFKVASAFMSPDTFSSTEPK